MAPLDVVLAPVKVGWSADPRPCIVVRVATRQLLLAVPCSSQFDLYRPGTDFLIPDHHPDFKATGLSRSSYVIGGRVFRLDAGAIMKTYGRLSGELAEGFRRWAGLP